MQVTIFYDSILMFQYYILYSHKKVLTTSENSEEIHKPLIYSSSSDQQIHDSVWILSLYQKLEVLKACSVKNQNESIYLV